MPSMLNAPVMHRVLQHVLHHAGAVVALTMAGTAIELMLGSAVLRAQPSSAPPAADAPKQLNPETTPLATNFRTAPKTTQVELPVWLDQKEVAFMRTQLNGNRLQAVHKAQLYAFLAARLTPTILSEIADIWTNDTQTWVDASRLSVAGIRLEYDPQAVLLRLAIPLSARKTQVVSFNNYVYPKDVDITFIKPQAVSLIVNQQLGLNTNDSQGARNQRVALTENIALRLSPWLLEAEIKASSTHNAATASSAALNKHAVVRGDMTAIHDFPSLAARLKVGDYTQRTMGSLASQPLLGVQIARADSLDEQRNQLSKPAQTLSLPNGAAVDIYINGALARSLRLEAGVHDLQQLPVVVGANEVAIRVTEPGKPALWYKQSFFFNATLLAQNAYDYQWSVGAPLKNSTPVLDAARQYDYHDIQLASTHRYGVSPTLTLGAGVQIGQKTQQSYLESAAPFMDGLWGNEVTFRRHAANYQVAGSAGTAGALAAAQTGWQAKSQWSWSAKRSTSEGWHSPSVNTQGVYRSGLYTDIQGLNTANQEWGLRVGASYAQQHSTSLSYRHSRYLDGTSRYWSGGWVYKINPNWSLDTVIAHTSTKRSSASSASLAANKSVQLTLRWQPKSEGFSNVAVSSSIDPYQHKRSVDYSQQVATEHGVWHFSALDRYQAQDITNDSLALQTTQTRLHALRSNYQHSRFELDAQYDRYTYKQLSGMHYRSEKFSVLAANAIGYAGGQWFTSRPIYDSAAVIVVPEKLSSAAVFMVDSHPAAAKYDGWGAPVVTPLAQTISRELTLDAERLGKGQNLAQDRFWLKPNYRSVSLIELALNPQTQVTGQILDAQGKPSPLLALLLKGDAPDEEYDVFTNRQGIFFTPALKPGAYTLNLLDGKLVQRFQVSPDSEWKISLPPVRLPSLP